jgi:DNA-binding CsgD family transcriptional regulator
VLLRAAVTAGCPTRGIGTQLALRDAVQNLAAPSSLPPYAQSTDMHRSIRHQSPKLDASIWQRVCADVLAQMGVGVIGCDAGLRILAATKPAVRLLASFRRRGETPELLPLIIARACRDWLDDARPETQARPVRLDSDDKSAAVHASFARVAGAPVSITVSLRRQVLRDDALRDVLHDAWQVSARELQLITMVRQGLSNRQIAEALGLTYGTVKVYLHQLFERLDVRSRPQLIALVEQLCRDR